MKRTLFLLMVLIVLSALAACTDTIPEEIPTGVVEVGDPVAGRKIYETGGETQIPCMTCHTLDGTELVGPSLMGIADRAATRSDLTAEDYLRQSITDPAAFLVEDFADVMNKEYVDKLTDEDIDNVIAFLLTQ